MTDPLEHPDAAPIRSKLAQLLIDTVTGLHPTLAQLTEEKKAEFKEQFLDGLEDHTAALVGPLLSAVVDSTTMPEQLVGLVQELGVPTEQFTGIISQFFIFGVMFTLAQAMLAPFVQQLNNDVWSAHPDRPIPPPDIATAVVRGITFGNSEGTPVPSWAATEAAKSGFKPEVFATLVGITGMAPALQLLFEMIRRGIIQEGELNGGGTTLVSGIQQSDIKDEWIEAVSKLRYVQPTAIDFVRAAVQAQMNYDEAKSWATKVGLEPAGWIDGNPDWFDLMYHTAGRPPGPVEMGHAALRGFMPWSGTGPDVLSFEQGVRESDIKDKWIPILQKLAQYYPPPGEVRQLLLHGGIDEATALKLWADDGIPDDIAKAYLHLAQIEQVTQDKALAKGDILTLVQEQAIDDEQALSLLEQIGYSGHNADFVLEMAHARFELDALRSVVRRVASLYTSKKITTAQAQEALKGLGMPSAQIDSLLKTLENQRAAEVLTPSAAQIASGYYYGIIPQDAAQGLLEALGYSPWNAWFVLSVRMHAAQPNQPAVGPQDGFNG